MSILSVRNLSKAFGGVHAVENVSFELRDGEFLALIGPNGAGKSTCFNMINGQLAPDRGDIALAGRSIVGLHPGGTADIQKVIMARRIGIGRSTREEAGTLA